MAIIASAAAYAGAVPAAVHAAARPRDPLTRYTVTDLGTLGGTFGFATAINDEGWVDGFSNLQGDVQQHAFLWRDGVMTDLGTLGGPNSGLGFWGQAPNERGAIAGTGESATLDPKHEQFCNSFNNFTNAPATPYECHPFVWRDGTTTPLPTFGGNNGAAEGINDRGQIVGAAETASIDPTCTGPGQVLHLYPTLWKDGVIHQLPLLPGDTGGGANAINNKGQAVGVTWGTCSTTPSHAVLWDHGMTTALGSLGGTAVDDPAGINNRGQVVGFSSVPGDVYYHGFYWDRHSGMKDLGTLPGDVYSGAVRINSQGQIVGFSCDANINCRAVLWENGVIADLNTLTAAGSPSLGFAFGINSSGEIVGMDLTSGGEMHAFLATPNDEELAMARDRGATRRASSQTRRVVIPAQVRTLLWQRLRFGRQGTPLQ